jgi:hypothetical protein
MKDDEYFFHQTPVELAKDLLKHLDIIPSDKLLEPFKGEGAFYNNFPAVNTKYFTEIEENIDYKTFTQPVEWVISNPPFKLNEGNERTNAFWFLLNHYASIATKGIAFLANDYCLSTLTPNRLKIINDKGWYLNKIVVCSVKKWRGRYFFIIFNKVNKGFYNHLLTNYK